MPRIIYSYSGIWAYNACAGCARTRRCCEISQRRQFDPYFIIATEWLCTYCIDRRHGSDTKRMSGEHVCRHDWSAMRMGPYAQGAPRPERRHSAPTIIPLSEPQKMKNETVPMFHGLDYVFAAAAITVLVAVTTMYL